MHPRDFKGFQGISRDFKGFQGISSIHTSLFSGELNKLPKPGKRSTYSTALSTGILLKIRATAKFPRSCAHSKAVAVAVSPSKVRNAFTSLPSVELSSSSPSWPPAVSRQSAHELFGEYSGWYRWSVAAETGNPIILTEPWTARTSTLPWKPSRHERGSRTRHCSLYWSLMILYISNSHLESFISNFVVQH